MSQTFASRPSAARAPAPAALRTPVQLEAATAPAPAAGDGGAAGPAARPDHGQAPSGDLRAASTAAATSIADQRAGSGGGDWSDPFGAMINRRIIHAPDASALASVRSAVEAAVGGDLHPLAALIGGHSPRLTPPELQRLLRHCDARARVLAQRGAGGGGSTSTAPSAEPGAGQGAAPVAGPATPMAGPATPMAAPAPVPTEGPMSGAAAEREAARTAPPPRPDPAVVLASFERQAAPLERAFAEVRGGAAMAILRSAIAREARNLTPENPRIEVAAGATNGEQGPREVVRGGYVQTGADERGAYATVELERMPDGQVRVTPHVVPLEPRTLVARLGRYSFETRRRETAEDTRLERNNHEGLAALVHARPPAPAPAQP